MNKNGTVANLSKPGQTNNPNGRPKKGTCLTDLMQKYLSKSIEVKGKGGQLKKVKYRDLFVQQVLKLATAGDTTCLKLIWNYIDGMPLQKMDIHGDISNNPILEALNDIKSDSNTDVSHAEPETKSSNK